MKVEEVIWIASYPKSGNTWVHQVLKVAAEKYGFPPGANMDAHKLGDENCVINIFPRVRLTENNCTVLKTHNICDESGYAHSSLLSLRPIGSIYVRRYPLDVLLSYINFSRIQYANQQGKNRDFRENLFNELLGLEEAINYEDWSSMTLDSLPTSILDHALDYFSDNGMLIPTMSHYGSWLEHNAAWENSAIENKTVIFYEDCIKDVSAFHALTRLVDFTPEEIDRAVDVRNNRTIMARDAKSGTTVNNVFYNKMASYYYVNYFSKAAISRFLNKHGHRLECLGYTDIPG